MRGEMRRGGCADVGGGAINGPIHFLWLHYLLITLVYKQTEISDLSSVLHKYIYIYILYIHAPKTLQFR